MRTSEASVPSTALKRSSDCFVFSELYRITIPCVYSTLHTHPRSHRLWSVLRSLYEVFGALDRVPSSQQVQRAVDRKRVEHVSVAPGDGLGPKERI
jgi:hypothetical protein